MKLSCRRAGRVGLCCVAIVGLLVGLTAQTPGTAGELDLPVVRVVLYSSGVAFVEHRATVEGNARARMSFAPDQIRDVLKSMILTDQGGGRVEAVNYTSRDPVSKALKSFSIDLSDNPGLAGILEQMRGAQVTLMTPQALEGRIVGVEYLVLPGRQGQADQAPVAQAVVNLLCADGLRAVPLAGVSSIRPKDERLAQELNKALELILGAADTQRKMVDISFVGKGKRPVMVGYVTEAPVWKSSYRLDLGTRYLQGWAIVENVSDQDWNQVSLSLASGSPVSFVQDLYAPLYNPRPVVAPLVQGNPAPQTWETGSDQDEAEELMAADAPAAMAAPAPAMRPQAKTAERESALAKGAGPGAGAGDRLGSGYFAGLAGDGVAAQATGQKLGDNFFFEVANPVSLARRSGAMIPLVGQAVEVSKVSIYRASLRQDHPMSGALLRNTTGLRLPAGPLTVFDNGAYGGDALMESLGPGEERLISHGVDLDIQADTSQTSDQDIQQFSLSKGVLWVRRLTNWRQTYHWVNRGTTVRSLVLEHPRNSGRSLVEPAKADSEAPGVWRFNLSLKPGEDRRLVVREQTVSSESVTLLGSATRTWLGYTANKAMGSAVKAALEEALRLRNRADGLQTSLNDATSRRSGLEKDQERLRANLEAVGSDGVQGKRYLEKLMESETGLEKLDAELARQRDDLRKAQQAFDDYVRNLTVE